jgi:hypothetical protein
MNALNKKTKRDNIFKKQDVEKVFQAGFRYREFGWSIRPANILFINRHKKSSLMAGCFDHGITSVLGRRDTVIIFHNIAGVIYE